MEKNEFIRRAVGLPWIDRACSWKAMDCWGAVVMYFRYVYDEELPCVEGYACGSDSIVDGFNAQIADGKWLEVDNPAGDCIVFMSFKNGYPAHVGVVIDGKRVLHSAGSESVEGQVRCDKLDVFRRYHRDMKFYQYRGCRCL